MELGDDTAEFRAEMADWIRRNQPAGLRELTDWAVVDMAGAQRPELERALRHPLLEQWERALLAERLICPQWPECFGGRGWTPVQVAVFAQECLSAGVPRITRGMGESFVGPSVLLHGTCEQQDHFLPRIISGADRYCQGFSEPDHGSDLAAVTTRGVVTDGEVIVTGTKTWTSGGTRANMIFVLCRTERTERIHDGLSYVLLPLADNSIDMQPIRQLTGAHDFCQEYLDGARAPLFNVIGGLGNGWRVAMTTLSFERGGAATYAYLAFEREIQRLLAAARASGRSREPLVRQQLAWAYGRVVLMRYQANRLLHQLARDEEPGPEAAMAKLFWSEYHRSLGEIAMDVAGPDGLVRPPGDGYPTTEWQDLFLASRAGTIYSGTNEIQRNIIAERFLGLPKEKSWR